MTSTGRIVQRTRLWQHLATDFPYLWCFVVVASVTLLAWPLQQQGMETTIIPLYLIGVLVCASSAGRGPAVLSAIASFLAFKFFFVPPIFTFTIDDADDVLDLLIFIVTAMVAGGMAVRVREHALATERAADETAALYELSQAISAELDFERIAPLIVATATQLLACPVAVLWVNEPLGTRRQAARLVHGPAEVMVELPLRIGREAVGILEIGLTPTQRELGPAQRRLLDTLATQAALALERVRLAHAEAQAEALAESDRLKSTLLAAVSHDFRTPLASISAAADELAADDVEWSAAARQEFAKLIRSEGDRLNRLVMNLLDLTRLEAGVLRPQRGWYNIAEIISGVVARMGTDLAERGVALDVPDDLPLVPLDYVQIEQVLWNVLQNALKYSPAGSPLEIMAVVQGNDLLLRVADRGRGIPEAVRARVFDKFFRYEPPDQPRVPGSGIGLAICRGLVEGHGGAIALLDREEGGTVVEIRLRLVVGEQDVEGELQR